MKLSELPEGTQILTGMKVKTSDGRIGFWKSHWEKGVWLSEDENGEGRVFPIVVSNLRECLDWEVTTEPVNLSTFEN